MAINFPTSPTTNDIWTENDLSWKFNGTAWTALPTPSVAGNVAYTPAGTGAVTTDVETKLRENVSVKDFGAVGDGVTDDTSEILACISNVDKIIIPKGNYLVSSLTIDKPIYFEPDAKLTVASGETVTIRSKITSSKQHIFDGDGAIRLDLISGAGGEESKQCHISWFGVFPSENFGDQGALINKATSAYGNTREGELLFDNGVYGTDETIYVPRGLAIKGIGTRKTLFYPISDGFPVFETLGVAAHFQGIQFEPNPTIGIRTSEYINLVHADAWVDDVLMKNTGNGIQVRAEGARIQRIGWNNDNANGATGSALITIHYGRCQIDNLYGFLGKTYGADSIVRVVADTAKINGVSIRNINQSARSRIVLVDTTTQSITGLTISGLLYSANLGTAPDNAIEFNVASGTYIQGVNINDINIGAYPVDGITFNVENNGILEVVNISDVNILGSTSASARTGIKFDMATGSLGAIRKTQISTQRNIIRPSGQEVVVPVDGRVNVTVN